MMNSNRPYLLRALYDWICDNGLTPCLMVNADGNSLAALQEFVQDGRIVFNISPNAVRDLSLDNDYISFTGRFSARSMDVYFPVDNVFAIYARENNRGMYFQEEPQGMENSADRRVEKKKKPHLKIVK